MPALIVLDGPGAGQRLEIDVEVTLGRETHEPLQHDGEVSRRHAAVRPVGEGLEIEDLGSSNGTFVNDQRITETTPIRPGDTIRLGQTTLEMEATPASAATMIRDVPEAVPAAEPAPAGPEATAPIGADPGPGPVPADPPPQGPPPLGPPPAGPPPYGPPPGVVGRRPGIVTAAGIVLIAVGVLSAGFGVWRAIELFDLRGDVAVFESIFGPTDLESQITILVVLCLVGVVGSTLAIIGGARFLAQSRAGVILGMIGTITLIVAWGGYLAYQLIEGLSPSGVEWAGAIGSVVGAGAGLGLLLGGRRHVAAPRSTPWAA